MDGSLHCQFTSIMPRLKIHFFSVTLLLVSMATFSKTDGEKSTINCYQCHSKFNDDCKYLLVNSSNYYKPCNDIEKYAGQTPFCRKMIQTVFGEEEKVEVVVRKCGWIRHHQECYRTRSWGHHETVCQCFTDGCNFGTPVRVSLVLLLLPLFVSAVSMTDQLRSED